MKKVFRDWNIEERIGIGAYGKVYRITRKDFGHIYEAALKVIQIPQNPEEADSMRSSGMTEENVSEYFYGIVEECAKEFVLMSTLKGHSNIVSYEDHVVEKNEDEFGWKIFIRMELLTPLVRLVQYHAMSKTEVVRLGIHICQALEICREYDIIHRDIKPENIFVSKKGVYKLGDFGVARQLEKTQANLSKKGTFSYMAPEIWRGWSYNSTVDIYSLGLVLYHLLNDNREPFMPSAPEKIKHSDKERANALRLSGEPLPKPVHADGKIAEIILKACAYNPKDRYQAPEAMRKELEAAMKEEGEELGVGFGYREFSLGHTIKEKRSFFSTMSTIRRAKVIQVHDGEKNRKKIGLWLAILIVCIISVGVVSSLMKERKWLGNDNLSGEISSSTETIQLEKDSDEVVEEFPQTVPYVCNLSEEDARKQIETAQFECKVRYKYSDTIKKGIVISQQPEQGEEAMKGTTITAIVSKGIQKVKMPKIAGVSLKKAQKLLKKHSLKWTVSKEYHETIPQGQVIRQSVSVGKRVKKNTKIKLLVSKGREPNKVIPTDPPRTTPAPTPKKSQNDVKAEDISDWDVVN